MNFKRDPNNCKRYRARPKNHYTQHLQKCMIKQSTPYNLKSSSQRLMKKWTSREILTTVKGTELERRSTILSICRSAWLSKQHLNLKSSSKKLMKNSLLQSARQMHLHWEQLLLGDNPVYFQFCKSYPCRRWNRRA
jgi:hypothetical protein